MANEDVVVWYKPRCSKCRGAAEILAAHGVSARRVFYLDEPPPSAEIAPAAPDAGQARPSGKSTGRPGVRL